jgi:hypothetical protein
MDEAKGRNKGDDFTGGSILAYCKGAFATAAACDAHAVFPLKRISCIFVHWILGDSVVQTALFLFFGDLMDLGLCEVGENFGNA